jgi:hypothetical protein
MVVDIIVVGLVLLLFGFIGYTMMKNDAEVKKPTGKGQTIVLDDTPVDTSKEDEIKEKYPL